MNFSKLNKVNEHGVANFFGFIFVLCIILFILGSLFLMGITPLRQISQRNSLQKETSNLLHSLEQSALSGSKKILETLAGTEDVKTFVQSGKKASEVNVAINIVKKALNASIVYIMNNEGNVIASTSFIDDKGHVSSLTGNNYSFRPYFKGAMYGKSVIYSAVGITTGKRGIYSSWPIKSLSKEKPIGVVVIKLGLENVDRIIEKAEQKVMLLNSEHIVFASNVKKWMYNLNVFDADTFNTISEISKQYNSPNIDTLPFSVKNSNLNINDTNYFVESARLKNLHWKLVVIEEENSNYPLNKNFIKIIIITASAIILLGIIIILLLYIIKRNKRAETELKQHQENLKITIDSIADGIIAIDNKDFIVEINTVAKKLTGFTEYEALGKKIKEVFRVVKSGTYKPLLELLDNESSEEIILLTKSNNEIEISKLATPIKNYNGDIVGNVIVFRDITHEKETNLKLQKLYRQTKIALQKAEESDKLKTAFLQNISHEIRTPLNGIIGFSELLTLTTKNEEIENYRTHIIDNSKHLVEIIQDVVEVSKFESGKVELQLGAFNLNEEIHKIYNRFKKLNNPNIEFKLNVNVNDANAIIETDKKKVRKIITNLLDNAFKFTNSGVIELGYSLSKNDFNFFVKDSGIGISRNHHSEIFKRFSQLSTQDFDNIKGVGIGLTLAQKYVHLLKGSIWLESKVNKGTTFFFTIPNNMNK